MLQKSDKVQGRKIKSLVCTKLGDPTTSNNLSVQFTDVSEKTPCPPHCVRISVRAASLNFADALQIQGEYQEKKKTPFVPGSECSGVITELGRDNLNIRITAKTVPNEQWEVERRIRWLINEGFEKGNIDFCDKKRFNI